MLRCGFSCLAQSGINSQYEMQRFCRENTAPVVYCPGVPGFDE
jgi:hypothetical protein